MQDTTAGTPQGGILSPLLANVALSVLDEFIVQQPGGPASSNAQRARRQRHGQPNFRLIRYADDWCLMIRGTKTDAETLKGQIEGVLATMGLRLSPDKTLITHIDEGLDFLGWRIQRHRKKGTSRHYVYVYPARKAVHAVDAGSRRSAQAWVRGPAARSGGRRGRGRLSPSSAAVRRASLGSRAAGHTRRK